MSTHVTLEDGRLLGTTNGSFDCIVELVAAELRRRAGTLPGLAEWLLEQRCEVQGPGIGYLDLRELSPRAAGEFKSAFLAAHGSLDPTSATEFLRAQCDTLRDMWASIDRGEPPQALTSEHWRMSPPSGRHRGPGW